MHALKPGPDAHQAGRKYTFKSTFPMLPSTSSSFRKFSIYDLPSYSTPFLSPLKLVSATRPLSLLSLPRFPLSCDSAPHLQHSSIPEPPPAAGADIDGRKM